MHRSPATRTKLYMEQVLEQTCRSLPHGGDHEVRAFIAERLSVAAQDGWTTLGELGIVARRGLADYTRVNPHRRAESSSTRYPTAAKAAE
jgi:hypothetical protein